MADVVIAMKIMPQGVDIDLEQLEKKVRKKITAFGGRVLRVEQEPVAFGLVALKVSLVMDESRGDTEPLEDDIKSLKEVASAEVVGVSRALG